MKGANTSSINAPLCARMALNCTSTQELTTIGRVPYCSPAARMRSRAWAALPASSTKAIRSVANCRPPNWVSRLWPMVSAVIPVPSET